jgi:hypothetical protein
LSSRFFILSIFDLKFIFSSFFSVEFVMYQISIGGYESTHFIHFLSSILTFHLIKDNINCINVISAILNFAIANANAAIKIHGNAAICHHTEGANHSQILYHIQHHIITIVSCFRLSHTNIGSSFSICTGILYCIYKYILIINVIICLL